MKISTLKTHIELLLYLYEHPNSILNEIQSTLDISYSTAHKILEKYKVQEIVNRTRKEPLILGGDKYEYYLSEKGILFLKELHQILQNTLYKGFETSFIRQLDHSAVKFTASQKKELKKRLKSLFL